MKLIQVRNQILHEIIHYLKLYEDTVCGRLILGLVMLMMIMMIVRVQNLFIRRGMQIRVCRH